MLNAIQYFDQKTPAMIIAGKKDGSDDLGIFYSGSLKDLQILRDLINESIDLLQNPAEETAEVSIYAA